MALSSEISVTVRVLAGFAAVVFLTSSIALGASPSGGRIITCYSCHMEPKNNACYDALTLQRERHKYEQSRDANFSTDTTSPPYTSKVISECAAPYDKCVIETITDDQNVRLMYRDCSDGRTFSTNVSNTRLASITADNNTHCAYQEAIRATVCITLCPEDFCNGPLYTSGASLIGWSPYQVIGSCAFVVAFWVKSWFL